eukprot:TRINITY_DN2896_c0_g1_i2.p1 TRINITY_DN2896_c0_g1~~TRINITY_DN2896_c0_g1_i2.p1  ORF type:complete len:598 (+),score=65.36 TRINITY_DN2896_c0_g1_i2:108-1901(+)
MIDILTIEDVGRSIFRFCDFATVLQFCLTSNQNRRDGPIKFVTSVDLWTLSKFSIVSMLESVCYLLRSIPTGSVSRISSMRMPTPRKQDLADYTTGEYVKLIHRLESFWPNLTSLHVVGSAEEDIFWTSDLLRCCSALKKLHYCGLKFGELVKYLQSQPQLEAIGISAPLESLAQEPVGGFCAAVGALIHRPKVVSIKTIAYSDLSAPAGWARGADRVVLDVVAPLTTSLENSLGVPLHRCWSMIREAIYLDPFEESDVTLLLSAKRLFLRGLLETPERNLEYLFGGQEFPLHIKTEALRYVLDSFNQTDRHLALNNAFYWAHVEEAAKSEYGLFCLAAALRHPVPEVDFTLLWKNTSVYKPLETAIVFFASMLRSVSPRRELSRLEDGLRLTTIEKTIFSGKNRFQDSASLVEHLEEAQDAALTLRVWNALAEVDPIELEVLLQKQIALSTSNAVSAPIPFRIMPRIILNPSILGLTTTQLVQRRDVQDYIVEWFAGRVFAPPEFPRNFLQEIFLSPTLLDRMCRAARIYRPRRLLMAIIDFFENVENATSTGWMRVAEELVKAMSAQELNSLLESDLTLSHEKRNVIQRYLPPQQ